MIYFIRSGDFVKIGFSHAPWRRLSELQTGNPTPLKMLAIMHGDERVEVELHGRFSADRVNLEWFRLSPDIQTLIESHKHTAIRLRPSTVGKWRIEYNRRATGGGYIYHWLYRFGSGTNRATVYGGMVQEWMRL